MQKRKESKRNIMAGQEADYTGKGTNHEVVWPWASDLYL
jgi:hypothetical protein